MLWTPTIPEKMTRDELSTPLERGYNGLTPLNLKPESRIWLDRVE
jgi:hypothetical protein